eukprot:m.73732 g.73732  ORF g.73732 m.73732 type:complete len:57 (-) comp12373_c0_seq6:50-220(-)
MDSLEVNCNHRLGKTERSKGNNTHHYIYIDKSSSNTMGAKRLVKGMGFQFVLHTNS